MRFFLYDPFLILLLCGCLGLISYLTVASQGKQNDNSLLPRSITNTKVHQWVVEHSSSVRAWTVFLTAAIIIFRLFSDAYFSALLSIASMISMMSFAMVLYKIEINQSVEGVSGYMMLCYVLILASRLISIVFWEGYLPWDSTGDGVYQGIEFVQLVIACVIVYSVFNKYAHTYNDQADTLNPAFLIVPTCLIACIFHPSLNKSFMGDATWAFALYLEALAALPQLVLFHKEKQVQAFTSHFLAAQCLSKVLNFIFWFATASELNSDSHKFHGPWVITIQAVQLLIMADFIYQYIKCVSRGVPVQFVITERV